MIRAAAMFMLLLAVACAVLGIATLANLVAEYRDDSDSTYLVTGLPLVALAIAIVARLFPASRPGWRRSSTAVTLASCVAALGIAALGIVVVDESLWQLVALAAVVSIVLMAPWPEHARND